MSQLKHNFQTTTDSSGREFKSTCLRCRYTVAGNGQVISVLDENDEVILGAVEDENCYAEADVEISCC
jgi:hypothetical protein